jgi:hypothetical protein
VVALLRRPVYGNFKRNHPEPLTNGHDAPPTPLDEANAEELRALHEEVQWLISEVKLLGAWQDHLDPKWRTRGCPPGLF